MHVFGAITPSPTVLNLPCLYFLICDMGLVIQYPLQRVVAGIKWLSTSQVPRTVTGTCENSEVCFLFRSAHLNT